MFLTHFDNDAISGKGIDASNSDSLNVTTRRRGVRLGSLGIGVEVRGVSTCEVGSIGIDKSESR